MRKTVIYIVLFIAFHISLSECEMKEAPALTNLVVLHHTKYSNAVSHANNKVFCLTSMFPNNTLCVNNQGQSDYIASQTNLAVFSIGTSKNKYYVNFEFFETGVSPPLA